MGEDDLQISGLLFTFVFNGHNLMSENEYTLIYYPNPWQCKGLICLGSGLAHYDKEDGDINVHIMGSVKAGNLPALYDWNSGSAYTGGSLS